MSGGKKATATQGSTETTGLTGNTSGTSVTGVSPYSLAKPGLQAGLSGLMSLYNKGQLAPKPSTSAWTNQGIDSVIANAKAGAPALQTGVNAFKGFAGGGNTVSSAGQTAIAGKALGPSYSEGNLAGVARGDFLNADDPNFERLLSRSTDSASLAAKQAAGARGRYGGDYAQENVARTVGDTEAQARYQRYNDERSRQVEANSLMDQMRQGGLNIGLNATNSASSIGAANRDRQLTAAAGLPGAVDSLMNPGRAVIGAGQLYEGRSDERNAAPANNLMALLQGLGIATPYGTTATTTSGTQTGSTTGTTNGTATTKQPSNLISQLLGGGLGLASLFNV
jgi:hypothetical protein